MTVYPSATSILEDYGIPATPASVSLFEQVEDFEFMRWDGLSINFANTFIDLRLETASLYCKLAKDGFFRAEGPLGVFAYLRLHYGHPVIKDKIPADLWDKISDLTTTYKEIMRAIDEGQPIPEEIKSRDIFSTCIALHKCFFLAQCKMAMRHDINRPRLKERVEIRLAKLEKISDMPTTPDFDRAFRRTYERLVRNFTYQTGHSPRPRRPGLE